MSISNQLSLLTSRISNSLLNQPNDRAEVYITPKAKNRITKFNTSQFNATLCEPIKKDGTIGKRTLILKER